MISSYDRQHFADADRWEHLITSYLPQLIVFKFIFNYDFWPTQNDTILDKFQKFQNHFWCEQHHWYTDISYYQNRVIIYTIPYMSNTANYNNLPVKIQKQI